MYDCLLYPLNYEEYKKNESEIDSKLCNFSEAYGVEDEDFLLLDEAYIIKLDIDYFEPDTSMDTEYFLVLIGDVRFDHDGLCDVIYGWSEEYQKYLELKKKNSKKMTREELFTSYQLSTKFGFIESADLNEEFEMIMNGEESEYGEIVKKIWE